MIAKSKAPSASPAAARALPVSVTSAATQRDAVAEMRIVRMRDASLGKGQHFRRVLDQHDRGAGTARCDGKTGGTGARAEIGEPAGKARRHRRGQHHRIHAGAMAGALWLHQPEIAAVEGVDRRGWFAAGRHRVSALSRS